MGEWPERGLQSLGASEMPAKPRVLRGLLETECEAGFVLVRHSFGVGEVGPVRPWRWRAGGA